MPLENMIYMKVTPLLIRLLSFLYLNIVDRNKTIYKLNVSFYVTVFPIYHNYSFQIRGVTYEWSALHNAINTIPHPISNGMSSSVGLIPNCRCWMTALAKAKSSLRLTVFMYVLRANAAAAFGPPLSSVEP